MVAVITRQDSELVALFEVVQTNAASFKLEKINSYFNLAFIILARLEPSTQRWRRWQFDHEVTTSLLNTVGGQINFQIETIWFYD